MSDMLKKLMEKKMKSGKQLSDSEQEAKMSVLNQLKNSMDDVMSEKANGLKKVSVMSDSEEGLKAGLDKAKDIVQNPELGEAREALPIVTPDSDELNSEDEDEDQHLSEEEIDEKLSKLMALKEKLKG